MNSRPLLQLPHATTNYVKMAPAQPELKKVCDRSPVNSPWLSSTYRSSRQYLDKRLFVQLNGSRKVIGILRGYDVRASNVPHICVNTKC